MIRGTVARMSAAAAVVLAICLPSAAHGSPPVARFTLGPAVLDPTGRLRSEVREGYISLSWEAGEGHTVYELQSVCSGAFSDTVSRYQGPDTTSFISGLEDGDHYFRVRARHTESENWGPWSDPIIVPVRHHSMTLAWWLFGLGAGIFGMTVAFVIANARRAQPSEVAGD